MQQRSGQAGSAALAPVAGLGLPRFAIVLSIAIGLLVFLAHAYWAVTLERSGAFAFNDVMFDTDAADRIASFAHGWDMRDRSHVHPHLGNMFSLPLRFVAKLGKMAGLVADELDFRARRAAGRASLRRPGVDGLRAGLRPG